MTTVLSAPCYELGETVVAHAAIADLTARAGALGIAPAPAMWGWGEVRSTARDLAEIAIATGAATLAAAGSGCDIDAVILCSTRFPGGAEEHGPFVGRILSGLGLRDVAFHGLTLHRCANLLAATALASALVAAGVHRDVLVVTTDRVPDTESRVQKYALFSDGGASCVVSRQAHSGGSYEIVATANARDLTALDHDDTISADLARAANKSLLARTGLELADIDAVMHANLVIPVVMLKERQAGFSAAQLDAANISRFGHCFAADPLINLVDRGRLGHVPMGGHVVLTTSVPGERYAVLLRHLPDSIRAASTDQELAS